jgi:hypothetical protein
MMPAYRTKWTRDVVEQAAQNYLYKWEFVQENSGAAKAAKEEGYFDDLTAHMLVKQNAWTYESVKAEAEKYEVRDHFARGCPGAMKWAKRHGVYDEICEHMGWHRRGDFDAVYIWKVKDEDDVYKVGVTSYRLKDKRINWVSNASGYEVEGYILKQFDNACEIETQLLSLGDALHDADFNGATEFRRFTADDLVKCFELLSVDSLESDWRH